MKRNTILLLQIIWILSILQSCKKSWFEERPNKNTTGLASVQDFEMLLDNNLMNQNMAGLPEIASDGHYIPENVWLTQAVTNSFNTNQRNAYTWTNNFLYTIVDDWEQEYQRLFYANFVLDKLSNIFPQNSDEKDAWNRVKGNALFHRAKAYLNLAQQFAAPYDKKSENLSQGIVMKVGIDITEISKQSTVQETYEQILKDLKESVELLPDLALFLTRGSKPAAFGLLARTCLIMQNYDEAGKYSDSCLKYNKTLIDYNTIPSSNSNIGLFNPEVIFHSQILAYPFLGRNMLIDQDLYDLYEEEDLRKTRFFTKSSDGKITFKGRYTGSTVHFSGVATDEIYLIRSECFARNGELELALKYLNDLLITRWSNLVSFLPKTASNNADALRIILEERRKELLLRGIRWSDLRRLNLEESTKKTLSRTIGGELYNIEPNSFKYTFPIPKDVLDLAHGIKQTPGWETP